MKKLKGTVRKSDTDFDREQKSMEKLEKELADICSRAEKIEVDENAEEELVRQKRTLSQEITTLTERIEDLEARYGFDITFRGYILYYMDFAEFHH